MPRGGILALATASHGLGAFSALAVAPLSPFLLEALGLSRGQVGFLLPAVYLGGVVMSLPAGWLVDRLGVRAALAVGQLLLGAAVAVAAWAQTLPPFLAFLVAGGLGFSVLNPATGRAIIDWFPPPRRGMAMGVKQTGLTLGGLAAALALPPLALALSWRHALAAAGAVSLVSAAAVALLYREPRTQAVPVEVPRPRLTELGVFLRRPAILVVFGCGFLLSIAQSSVLAYLVLYAKETLGVSAVTAGWLLALAQAGGTASRLVWGVVSDRSFGGRRRPGIVASASIGAGAYALLAFGETLPLVAVGVLAVVAGAGAFGWVGLYFALVGEIGGARHAGLLTGAATAAAWSGTLVGPPLFGLVLEATDRYAPAWLGLTTVAVVVALALPRLRPLVQRG